MKLLWSSLPVVIGGLLSAHALGQPSHQTAGPVRLTSGHYIVESSTADLKVSRSDGGGVVFDAAARAREDWERIAKDRGAGPIEGQYTYRFLSLVGPYLSFEEASYCDCGGVHPTAVKQFKAVNLEKNGSPASLTELFSDTELVAGLETDPVVSRSLGGSPKPKSLDRLVQRMRDAEVKEKDCDYGFSDDLLSSFAVYDVQGGKIAIRLSLPAAAQVCRGEMIQVGLSLPVEKARLAWFTQAKQGGVLMKQAGRLAATASVHFAAGK